MLTLYKSLKLGYVSISIALVAAALIVGVTNSAAQDRPHQSEASVVESGTLTFFRRQLPIGTERYSVTREGEALVLRSNISAQVRQLAMEQAAELNMGQDYTPRRFSINGYVNAWAKINRTIDIRGSTAIVREDGVTRTTTVPDRFFTVAAHTPASVQGMLIRYWATHGKPKSIPVPEGAAITVEYRGRDIVSVGNERISLNRYSVGGVTWARETIWLDDSQRIFAVVATLGVAYELVRSGYESALPTLVNLARNDALTTLAQLNERLRPKYVGTIAIKGGRIIDATGRAPIDDGVLLVRDGRIVAVGKRGRVRIPSDAAVVDATGKTVLPGLWEMHTHFSEVELGPAYLAGGVTTARDLANVLEFEIAVRDAIASGRGIGPRLLLAGLVDGPGEQGNGTVRAATPEEARAVVRMYHRHGFEQIKIYNLIQPDVLRAITAEAHRLGMTVTGHVPRALEAVGAVEAGMDGIEHAGFVSAMLPPEVLATEMKAGRRDPAIARFLVPNSPEVERVVRLFKERGTVLDPTLGLFELFSHDRSIPVATIEPGVEKLPPTLGWLRVAFQGLEPPESERARLAFEKTLAVVGVLHRAGVPIVAGTDVGVNVHSLHRELELFVRAGFTPMEAIQAATIVPARAMKLDKEVGTLEPGKRADVILVDGDPLRSISDIRRVSAVMTNGRFYESAALWQSVGFKP